MLAENSGLIKRSVVYEVERDLSYQQPGQEKVTSKLPMPTRKVVEFANGTVIDANVEKGTVTVQNKDGTLNEFPGYVTAPGEEVPIAGPAFPFSQKEKLGGVRIMAGAVTQDIAPDGTMTVKDLNHQVTQTSPGIVVSARKELFQNAFVPVGLGLSGLMGGLGLGMVMGLGLAQNHPNEYTVAPSADKAVAGVQYRAAGEIVNYYGIDWASETVAQPVSALLVEGGAALEVPHSGNSIERLADWASDKPAESRGPDRVELPVNPNWLRSS